MADRTARLRVIVDSDTDGAKKAGAALGGVDEAADEASKSLDKQAKSSDKAGDAMRELARDGKALQAEYTKTTAKIKELDTALIEGGNDSKVRRSSRAERGWLRELDRMVKDLEKSSGTKFNLDLGDFVHAGSKAGGAFSTAFASAMESAPKAAMPALIAAVVAAAGQILPGLGAMIGGGLIGATGTAALAAGILSASKDSRVRDAAAVFGRDIAGEFFAGSDAFAAPVSRALESLGSTVKSLNIADTLGKVADEVEVIGHGIEGFANNFMPQLDAALSDMDPYADVAAEGIAEMGDALGEFIREVQSSPGTLQGLNMLFKILNGTVVQLGRVLSFLGDGFAIFTMQQAKMYGALEDVAGALGLDDLQEASAKLNNMFEEIQGGSVAVDTFGAASDAAFDPFNQYLREAQKRTQGLTMDLAALVDHAMAAGNANIAFEQAIDDLTDSFNENGRTLDINTQKGRDNMRALNEAIADAARVRDELAKTQGLEAANAAFNAMLQRIYAIGAQAGVTKAQLDAMVKNPYRLLVTYTVSGGGGNVGAHAKYQLQGATGDILGGQRAAGGPVMAGVPYMINERGRETVTFPSGGTVHPANLSPAAGGETRVVVDMTGGDDEFLRWFRKRIRVVGGTGANSVQLALGRTA